MSNKKVYYGGSKWCCVPQCKFKQGDSLHKFPADRILKKKWVVALKIGKNVTSSMFVCAAHFQKCDFMPKSK